MKILVTGATGFIGNHVIGRLLKDGHQVIASSTSIEKARLANWFGEVTYVSHKIGEKSNEDLYKKFGEPDRMIHLAWTGLPDYRSMHHIEDVLWKQYAFLKQMISEGLEDLLVTGTCFEYGMVNGCLSEDRPSDPQNPYGIAKDSLRKFLQMLQSQTPFRLKWVRLFYMYGAGQNEKSLFSQLENALANGEEIFNMSGGEQVRDFLPVSEVASHIVSIAVQDKVEGIINCCSGKPVKVRELAEDLIKRSGKQIKLNLGYYPYPDYEPMEFWGDNKKLRQITGE